MEAGEKDETNEVVIAGRVKTKREAGAGLIFYDLFADGHKIQIMASAADHKESADIEEYATAHGRIRRGDIIGVRGFAGKSKRGELSVFPTEVKLLSACLHML